MQTARGEGMQLMDSHLLELLNAGKVTAEEACHCAVDKRSFEAKLPKEAKES